MRTKALLLCLSSVLLVSVTASPTTVQDSGQASVVAQNNSSSNALNTTASTQAVPNASTASNVTQASSDETNNASTSAEDDDTLPEGMSESLADFVMDMLKGQFGNATKKASAASTAAGSQTNSTLAAGSNTNTTLASSNATSAVSSNTATTGAQGTAAGKTGTDNTETGKKPTPPASTDEWESTTWDYDDWASTEDYLSTTREPFSKDGKANCNAEVDLDNYCIVDDLVSAYFHGDLTAKGLRSPIFDMGIVERLKSCPRGEWCLDNELDAFRGMQERFYKGPLCEETMWECIFDIMVQREQCEDKEFMFVVDAADLMCELFDMPPIEENEKRCFAHVLAALHVTYADFLASNMSDVKPETAATCEGYGFKMTKTYLCADSSCDDLFDSRIAMEKFARWGWFMNKVEDRVIKCDLTDKDTCGALKEQRPPATSRTWFGMTTESFWPDYTTTTDSYLGDDYYDQGGSMDLNGERTAEEDESLMMALSVASAVGLLFMVLGLVFWRRNRRRNLLYYRGDGYGKLSADEGPLLPKSSD